MFSGIPVLASDSLSVMMNKSPSIYNIGDSISITGFNATPNALVSIKIFDSGNIIKAESEVQVASDGAYWVSYIYTL